MPDPFPLNETALQAAGSAYGRPHTRDGHLRDAISTYLREAGFEVEAALPGGTRLLLDWLTPRGRESVLAMRLVGEWQVPVDQVEEEE